MNIIISAIAAEGIPAWILQQAIRATGLHGGARFTTAFAALGPGGMIGGLVTLAAIQAVTFLLSEATIGGIYLSVVRELCREGMSFEDILGTIDGYPVSRGLKDRLREEAALHVQFAEA